MLSPDVANEEVRVILCDKFLIWFNLDFFSWGFRSSKSCFIRGYQALSSYDLLKAVQYTVKRTHEDF